MHHRCPVSSRPAVPLIDSDLPAGSDLVCRSGCRDHASVHLTDSLLLQNQNCCDTLWHQLRGRPAFGPLVGSGIELERLPVTLTTWEEWYAEHPETRVMAFETGFVRDYGVGAAYADYFASPETMFPVWRRSQLLPDKSWVFTQLIDGQPKAYPMAALS